MAPSFKIATTPDELRRAFAVRSIVFIGEQHCPFTEEFDGLDPKCTHILGEEAGEPVAAARIRAVDGWAKLERIAVLQSGRGRGVGHALVEYMLEVARARGFQDFKLHAQAHLVDFYRVHGFVPRGEKFEEAGIEHYLMVRGEGALAGNAAAESADAMHETTAPPPAPNTFSSVPPPVVDYFAPAPAVPPPAAPSPTAAPLDLVYVGFWPRVLASIIDALLVSALTWPVLFAYYGRGYLDRVGFAGPLDFALSYVLPTIATILFWRYKGASPGKMAIGARIVDARTGGKPSTKQLVGRYFAYLPATLALGIGIFWVAWDPRKQGWHDKLANTVVVRRERHPPAVRFEARAPGFAVSGAVQRSTRSQDEDWMPF
jgi:predicted GNAT family N-acyltransferase/uncharacterized RDD family membrane protein YckC